MKASIDKITTPEFGDKLVGWTCLYAFGFITAMLIFEQAPK